ncbi:hypothetical protein ISS05_00945 [Candidatus Woesearchaeota archaeon]|nr:hypothetical protein [Candidatus Woesearchaeota archaeon]
MKKGTLIIIFFLILPVIAAEISIKQNNGNYNLGDKISVSASVIEDEDVTGFFKVSLECTNYAMQYFVTPISLEKNFRTNINVPDLTATKDMLGSCSIEADLEGNDGTVDVEHTLGFRVKKELNVSCESSEAIPGKDIKISCIAKKISLDPVQAGTANLNYDGNEFTTNVEDGIFDFDVFIKNDAPAGAKEITIQVDDNQGNYGNLIFNAYVEAIPTKLEIEVNKESFKPGETLEIKPVLYDHVHGLIDAEVNLEFTDIDDKQLISKDIQSGETASYVFNSFAIPGDYKVKAKSEGLTAERTIKIESLIKMKMTYANEKVLIKNIGNTFYDDKTTIILEDEGGKKYLIEKNINLAPGQEKEIDLSKEVPYGNYDVVLPEESISAETASDNQATNVIENVEIRDNRPVYKKAGEGVKGGMGMISGAAIGAVGFASAKPLFASVILVVIILVIVLFYSRDFIKSRVGQVKVKVDKKEGIHLEKKDGDTEGLFKDFKYGKG